MSLQYISSIQYAGPTILYVHLYVHLGFDFVLLWPYQAPHQASHLNININLPGHSVKNDNVRLLIIVQSPREYRTEPNIGKPVLYIIIISSSSTICYYQYLNECL